MGAEENKAAVRRLFVEVLQRGDQAARRELIHPEFVGLHAPGGAFVTPGGMGARGGGSSFRDAFPDGATTFDLLIAEGDYVVARWTFSGTHTGVFDNQLLGHFLPTGRRVIDRGVNIYRFQDGKIIENWLHRDELHLLGQLRGDADEPTEVAAEPTDDDTLVDDLIATNVRFQVLMERTNGAPLVPFPDRLEP